MVASQFGSERRAAEEVRACAPTLKEVSPEEVVLRLRLLRAVRTRLGEPTFGGAALARADHSAF